MYRLTIRKPSTITIFAVILLFASTISPVNAMSARGVLEEGKDYVHFDLTLSVNFTRAAFNITREEFARSREEWTARWYEWKEGWEQRHEGWRERWSERMADWGAWREQWKEDWRNEWMKKWNLTWEPEWRERWGEWEEWMEDWKEKWKDMNYEEIGEIPSFIMPSFRDSMKRKFEDLWHRHLNAQILSNCWFKPSSQIGLKRALGHSLNKTLQWIYDTEDVYIKNFDPTIELTTKTVFIDDTPLTTGLFKLDESFDLYGVVTVNSSGLFILSQFRHLNVTEKVDGRLFGYPGWVFTPGKAMFMDLSVFSVPLEEWNRVYDSATDTTSFTLVRDINVTTAYGSVVIDPEVSLTVPGRAEGSGDLITVKAIMPTDILSLRNMTLVAMALSLIAGIFWIGRRRLVKASFNSNMHL